MSAVPRPGSRQSSESNGDRGACRRGGIGKSLRSTRQEVIFSVALAAFDINTDRLYQDGTPRTKARGQAGVHAVPCGTWLPAGPDPDE